MSLHGVVDEVDAALVDTSVSPSSSDTTRGRPRRSQLRSVDLCDSDQNSVPPVSERSC